MLCENLDASKPCPENCRFKSRSGDCLIKTFIVRSLGFYKAFQKTMISWAKAGEIDFYALREIWQTDRDTQGR